MNQDGTRRVNIEENWKWNALNLKALGKPLMKRCHDNLLHVQNYFQIARNLKNNSVLS